jgi:hypothetical protein
VIEFLHNGAQIVGNLFAKFGLILIYIRKRNRYRLQCYKNIFVKENYTFDSENYFFIPIALIFKTIANFFAKNWSKLPNILIITLTPRNRYLGPVQPAAGPMPIFWLPAYVKQMDSSVSTAKCQPLVIGTYGHIYAYIHGGLARIEREEITVFKVIYF